MHSWLRTCSTRRTLLAHAGDGHPSVIGVGLALGLALVLSLVLAIVEQKVDAPKEIGLGGRHDHQPTHFVFLNLTLRTNTPTLAVYIRFCFSQSDFEDQYALYPCRVHPLFGTCGPASGEQGTTIAQKAMSARRQGKM
jgi:hypothetical protein